MVGLCLEIRCLLVLHDPARFRPLATFFPASPAADACLCVSAPRTGRGRWVGPQKLGHAESSAAALSLPLLPLAPAAPPGRNACARGKGKGNWPFLGVLVCGGIGQPRGISLAAAHPARVSVGSARSRSPACTPTRGHFTSADAYSFIAFTTALPLR